MTEDRGITHSAVLYLGGFSKSRGYEIKWKCDLKSRQCFMLGLENKESNPIQISRKSLKAGSMSLRPGLKFLLSTFASSSSNLTARGTFCLSAGFSTG